MEQFTEKPRQFPAVKFEGGIDNATMIINWLAKDFRIEAYYKPERLVEPLDSEMDAYVDPEAIVLMTPGETRPILRQLRKDCWLMPTGPEGRRFDIFDDESIEHYFNKVG